MGNALWFAVGVGVGFGVGIGVAGFIVACIAVKKETKTVTLEEVEKVKINGKV